MYQADLKAVRITIFNWLEKRLAVEAIEWIKNKLNQIDKDYKERDLYIAFGTAPRYVGKSELNLSAEEKQEAEKLRKGWDPTHWTSDQAARILFLLSLPHQDPVSFKHTLTKLFSTAEVAELTALYLSLPLLPHPKEFQGRTAEGMRTNMSVVFNAIALNNPYPAEYLDESQFNHLLLKAVFIGSPLHKIYGLDQRANENLARMLSDFAHERWAAGRTVSPELWRPVGPFINEKIFPDIQRLLGQENIQQDAAALAISSSFYAPAKELLAKNTRLMEKINDKKLSWEAVYNEWLSISV